MKHLVTSFPNKPNTIYFNEETTPISPEAQGKQDTVRYRILFDAEQRVVAACRNGLLIGKWKLMEGGREPNPAIEAICISPLRPDAQVRVHWLRILAWDGKIPNDSISPSNGDHDSADRLADFPGKLEALSEKDLQFSGKAVPLASGLLVQFPEQAPPPIARECRIRFLNHGEFEAAGLSVADQKAQFQTTFAEKLALPISAMEAIVFPEKRSDLPEGDGLLIFKDGDALSGRLLAAETGKPWRLLASGGQQIEIRPDGIGGFVPFRKEETPADGHAGCVELKNGDRFYGNIRSLTKTSVALDHPVLGLLTLPWESLLRVFPTSASAPRYPSLRFFPKGVQAIADAPQPFEAKLFGRPRLYLDGNYACSVSRAEDFAHSRLVFSQTELPDRYEISFDVLNSEGWYPDADLVFTETGKSRLDVGFEPEDGISVDEFDARGVPRRLDAALKTSWKEKLKIRSSRLNVRVFVDSVAGRVQVIFDGILVADTGAKSNERFKGVGKNLELQDSASSLTIFSNLRVAPWSGQLPTEDTKRPSILLSNADTVAGEIKEIRDGSAEIASDAGPLQIPLSGVRAIAFPGSQTAAPAAARLRLDDGSVIHAGAFQWDGKQLVGHSSVLGDIRVPANAIDEIILDPPPIRPSHSLQTGSQ